MSNDDANESTSGTSGIAGLKGVTLLGSQPGQSSTGKVDRYYIQRRSGKVFGPFEKALIRQMIEGEKLSGDEGVSQDKQVWLPILSVPEFANLFDDEQLRMTPRGVPTLGADDDPNPPGDLDNPFGPGARATAPGLPKPGEEEHPPNVHEEPTRTFHDSNIDVLMAPEAPLPSLADLPMPEPLDFDVSSIPGLDEGAAPILPPVGEPTSKTPSIPELPPPPGYGADPLADLPDLEPPGADLPELPGLPTGDGAQPPATERPSRPRPARARPSLSRGRSDDAELPRLKEAAAAQAPVPPAIPLPELPAPKSAPAPELPVLADTTAATLPLGSPPELPVPKSAAAPELPMPKSASLPELPVPKSASLPELPVPKSASLPELPVPKSASLPELPVPKSASLPELPVPKSAAVPELPMPKSATIPELPMPKSAMEPELPTPKAGQLPNLPLPKSATFPELPMPRRGQRPELPLPKSGAELPVLADGLDFFGDGKLPELPTPKFEDVHLPTIHDEFGDDPTQRLGTGDFLKDLSADSSRPLGAPGGTDFLLGAPTRERAADTFSGLDDDLLPPPTGDFDVGEDLLGDLGQVSGEAITLDGVDFGRPTEASMDAPVIGGVSLEAPAVPVPPVADKAPAKRPARKPEAKRIRRAKQVPTSRMALLGVLLLAAVGAGLYYAGVFDPSAETVPEMGGPGSAGEPDDSSQIVVARAESVELGQLRPGNYGDYVGFIQPARAAAASARQDRDITARLLVAQALMAAQYGEAATMIEDMAQNAEILVDSEESLHRLARGAYFAVNGDVVEATAVLDGIDSGEYAAMAQLMLGVAELKRYERALAAQRGVELSAVTEPVAETDGGASADTAPPGGAETSDPEGDDNAVAAAEAEEAAEPAGPAQLQPTAQRHLERAVRLDPQLVPAHYFLGVARQVSGDSAGARTAFEAALAVTPRHYPSLLGLSAMLIDAGELESAGRQLILATEEAEGSGSDWERSQVHELLGRVAQIRRDYPQAAQELERAFTTDPSNARALAQLSGLLHETRQYQRAIDFLEQHAPDRNTADVEAALARHQLGRAEALEGVEGEEAMTALVAELERARAEHPGEPRFSYLLGRVRGAQNLFDEAEALFTQATEIDDQYREAWLELAELARLSNENAEALELLERAEQVGEPDSLLEARIGDVYRRLDRPGSALIAYRRAVQVDPLNMQARLELARFEVGHGDRRSLERAAQQLAVAEAAGVDDAELHALFAEVEYGLGHLNQARERMNRVAEAGAETTEPAHLYLIGRINFDAGQLAEAAGENGLAADYYEAARQNFNMAWVEGHETSATRYWEARAMLAVGEIDRAVPILRRAIDQAIRDRQPHGAYQFWLGYSLEVQGQDQQALESYVVVDRNDLRWALEHPELFYRRGRLFARSRLFRRAKRDLEWTLILDRHNADASRELAEVHAMERDYERALELWLQSLQTDPDQPRVHYRLGMTYLRLENEQEALRHLEQARDSGYGGIEPDIFRTLGYIYKDARRNRDAVRELVRYLETGAVPGGSDEETEIHRTIERLGGRY